MPATALQLEQWPIGRLVEYERNPRKNDDVVDRMAQAIMEFGFRIPIVARSDGLVVDGHLRLKAARVLGLDRGAISAGLMGYNGCLVGCAFSVFLGQPVYAATEVSAHCTQADLWMSAHGRVYDVTRLLADGKHPGGAKSAGPAPPGWIEIVWTN